MWVIAAGCAPVTWHILGVRCIEGRRVKEGIPTYCGLCKIRLDLLLEEGLDLLWCIVAGGNESPPAPELRLERAHSRVGGVGVTCIRGHILVVRGRVLAAPGLSRCRASELPRPPDLRVEGAQVRVLQRGVTGMRGDILLVRCRVLMGLVGVTGG
jgi:hypothetical protein